MKNIQTPEARQANLSNSLPLPAIASGKSWTGDITIEEARAAFDVGSHNLKLMVSAPDAPEWLKKFNPLAGHRPEDAKFGSSTFFKETLESAKHPLDGAVTAEVHPGHGGADAALAFTVRSAEDVGTWYPLESRMKVVLRKVHGSLQAVLEKPDPARTSLWTFVLTNEGPKTGWVLASVYPGVPDPDPDMDGLSEGSEISLEEAARRGLRVKA